MFNKHAPIVTVKVRKNYAPWLSDKRKDLIKKRDDTQKRVQLTKLVDDGRHFKNLHNEAIKSNREDKKEWEERKLNNIKGNPASVLANVRTWFQWHNSGPPTKLQENGEFVDSPSELENKINSYFVDKVRDLKKTIPGAKSYPASKLRETMKERNCNFAIKSVTPDKVEKIVKSLKNSNSVGVDNISTYII